MESFGLYLHIPFCQHRCAYCDFNTYAGLEAMIPEYIDALCVEVDYTSSYFENSLHVHTIYLGGGTPSLLPVRQVEQLLAHLEKRFDLHPDAEISLEANPGTLSRDYLKNIVALGVNRLSLGMQSANQLELKMLEREHTFLDVVNGVHWARLAGIDNINLDLMFGLPDQSLDAWRKSLSLALDLHPANFSLYSLTLEHGTPMQAWVARGLMCEPDPDLAADMYEMAAELMNKHGYQQYEISNWAQRMDGSEISSCRHNLNYWQNLPYLGLGAGAHGYANNMRVANVLSPGHYIRRLSENQVRGNSKQNPDLFPRTPATANVIPINRETEIAETMMMGLRLTIEGVSQKAFLNRFGVSLVEIYAGKINDLILKGLLAWQGDNLVLTSAGRLLGNKVFIEFI